MNYRFTLTDDEDLGGLVPRGLRFGGLNLLEELLEDPHERLVVFGAEDFRDERAALREELAGQFESHQSETRCRTQTQPMTLLTRSGLPIRGVFLYLERRRRAASWRRRWARRH